MGTVNTTKFVNSLPVWKPMCLNNETCLTTRLHKHLCPKHVANSGCLLATTLPTSIAMHLLMAIFHIDISHLRD